MARAKVRMENAKAKIVEAAAEQIEASQGDPAAAVQRVQDVIRQIVCYGGRVELEIPELGRGLGNGRGCGDVRRSSASTASCKRGTSRCGIGGRSPGSCWRPSPPASGAPCSGRGPTADSREGHPRSRWRSRHRVARPPKRHRPLDRCRHPRDRRSPQARPAVRPRGGGVCPETDRGEVRSPSSAARLGSVDRIRPIAQSCELRPEQPAEREEVLVLENVLTHLRVELSVEFQPEHFLKIRAEDLWVLLDHSGRWRASRPQGSLGLFGSDLSSPGDGSGWSALGNSLLSSRIVNTSPRGAPTARLAVVGNCLTIFPGPNSSARGLVFAAATLELYPAGCRPYECRQHHTVIT